MFFVVVETKKAITIIVTACFTGESAGVRTRDPNIKSVVLQDLIKASPTAQLLKATC